MFKFTLITFLWLSVANPGMGVFSAEDSVAGLPVLLLFDPIEDFEGGPALNWTPLGDPDVFGTFDGAVSNPDTNGLNSSPMVGSYTKGASQFGGLYADLPSGFSLEEFSQLNVHVLAPALASSLTIKLYSPSQGLKAIDMPIDTTGVWQELHFGFGDYINIIDFSRIQILFDLSLETTDTWHFDNLILDINTTNPCEGVQPVLRIVDDYDCQRNIPVFTGANRLTVIPNPVANGTNPDPADRVGAYEDPQDQWSALVYNNEAPYDLSNYSRLSVKIWSESLVPLLFKLEGGSSSPVEVSTSVSQAGRWETYIIDFESAIGTDHPRLAIFFNAGLTPSGNDIYYIDDIEWIRGPYSGCVLDFETGETSYTDWTYFGNASGNGTEFQIIENPDPSGVNPSARVGIFEEYPGGNTWAGMYTQSLPAPIALPSGNKTVRMKVWADHAAMMTMKLERGLDGAPSSGDNNVMYSTPNAWQELTWDFSSLVPDGARYERLTLIMDIENSPDEIKVYFFDDVAIADSECGTTGTYSAQVKQLSFYPNPVSDLLFIPNADYTFLRIVDLDGRTLIVQPVSGEALVELDASSLPPGMYVLSAYSGNGGLRSIAKFVRI